ncbi:MAG: hypothetical protein UY70_C0011G0009 [Candidatus Kaiserbacteria bacterium GW2011_GWB1_52_6]|uniref:Uncharacterized protein n=1 Tax=Candidatus Kaiserbacteria bacterium GW2011_GWB1_52_6 TaxID=1618674 RepID=A0A0G1X9S5_9BACT|nr:MAG: hypothetical protein UY70_C0011G0009 [Candidatus Kaiserbacteria bacterium GW2011_GWB1_52_6]
MLKIFRISHTEFVRLSKERGCRIHGTHFALATFPLPVGTQGPKAACVVSKKVSLKAVTRNQIKRRCRECIRAHSSVLDTHRTYVFYAKKSSADTAFVDIRVDIDELIEKSNH